MKYLTVLFILFTWPLVAQDDLMNMLDEGEEEEKTYVNYAFKATRIINGHSTEVRRKGALDFLISHRFGRLNTGAYELFGLDQSNIRFALEYSLKDYVMVGVGRSSFEKTYDAFAKVRMIRQSEGPGSFPLTACYFTSVTVNTFDWKNRDTSRANYFYSTLAFTHQLLLTRKMNDRLSLQLMPTMVHHNMVYSELDPNDIFAIGAGGRYKITPSFSINAEYYYQINRTLSTYYYNSAAIAFELETGGHVFQMSLSNSRSMIEKGFITETTGRVLDGDIHFGFNIFRTF